MKKTLILTGPTASGKTSFAVRLARRIGAEIISADSRQVYRGLDIGSGKDINEYTMSDGFRVNAHLLDIADPVLASFSLADFLAETKKAMEDIEQRHAVPLVAGGTALWIHALLAGYHLAGGAPDSTEREALRTLDLEGLRAELRSLDDTNSVLSDAPNNRTRLIRRIEMLRNEDAVTKKEQTRPEDREYLLTAVLRSRSEIHANIEKRLDERLAHGMLDEAIRLHEQGVSWQTMEFFGLEYRCMALHLQGKISLTDMRNTLLCKIRQFAKRQDSWFRKMERDGFPIYWFTPEQFEDAVRLTEQFLAGEPLPPPAVKLSEISYAKPAHRKKASR